jgi:hypothetical protein
MTVSHLERRGHGAGAVRPGEAGLGGAAALRLLLFDSAITAKASRIESLACLQQGCAVERHARNLPHNRVNPPKGTRDQRCNVV